MVKLIRSLGKMSDYGDNMKYKWTPESTTLLVSVWTDKQVQKQLEYAQRPQLIWESVARYMTKKGYGVTAKQCRSRMKQVLVCYKEAKRAGTRAGVEQYYDSIDKVLKDKKGQRSDTTGFDTVDSAMNVKTFSKDVKAGKNNHLTYTKYGEPVESLLCTEALSPTWHLHYEKDYPDSPESNETVLAHPYRAFSPTRDAATNTLNGPSQLLAKCATRRRSLPLDEQPIRDIRDTQQPLSSNRCGEVFRQNAVENMQNQIIQENMQQHRNFTHIQLPEEDVIPQQKQTMNRRYPAKGNLISYFSDDNVPTKLRVGSSQNRAIITANDPHFTEDTMRMQNQLQQYCMMDNRAVPQEPRRRNFTQNLPHNYKDPPETGGFTEQNLRTRGLSSRNYSPDTAANLNVAFRQSPNAERNFHNLNETYDEQRITDNDVYRAMNATTMTNNATFNDDTLSIEFLEGSASPSPSDNGAVKSASVNSDKVPHAPIRVKKAQKLEQLMLSAITSQTEVVNKILAAQDAMVSRFLDLDRDRQNRLENRFDHLMNVVHATVLNKSSEKDSDSGVIPPAMHEQNLITNLEPPPRPGVVPPKLDLVPPKPCRVPCTSASANVELVNQKVIETRPGVVIGANNPPGAIWCKLGPVSQSPFVKAQQQLGLRVISNDETRTQSSAERRINREIVSRPMDSKTLIFETKRLLEIERQIEEQAENARILARMGQEVASRRKLFAGRGELNAGMILTAAFLDSERQAAQPDTAKKLPVRRVLSSNDMNRRILNDDEDEELVLLAGQVEQYERLRRLKTHTRTSNEPCDSSTPAKVNNPGIPTAPSYNNQANKVESRPKQTIQQLGELVMKSARWRDVALNEHRANDRFAPPPFNKNQHLNGVAAREIDEERTRQENNLREKRRSYAGAIAEQKSNEKALGWLQDRYSYGYGGDDASNNCDNPERQLWDEAVQSTVPQAPHPMGFTTENLGRIRQDHVKQERNALHNVIGFNPEILLAGNYGRRSVAFADLEAPFELLEKTGQATYPRQRRQAPQPPQQYNSNHFDKRFSSLPTMHKNMIDRYVQENRGYNARKQDENDDDDDDDKYFDSTMTMQPSRKTSITSNGTSSGKPAACVIS